jgi:hypothetical protein
MNAVILVVDRLHAGYIGAYGNTWVRTPTLDRLASESFLLDQAFLDSPQLDRLACSHWLGRHALAPDRGESRPALTELLQQADIASTLLTDEPALIGHPLARTFRHVLELPCAGSAIPPGLAPDNISGKSPACGLAETVEKTHLGQCFSQLIDWLESPQEPYLLWCHLRGLAAPWDAPMEFRLAYADDDAPPPIPSTEVPCRTLSEDYDPDDLWAVSQAYAGQISLLDTCLSALVEHLGSSQAGRRTLLAVTSARGFPLGEHHRIGAVDECLYAELVHMPMLLRFPDRLGATVRCPALVEPDDLWATLLDWFHIGGRPDSPTARSLMPLVRDEVEQLRDRLVIAGKGTERAIITPAWFFRNGDTDDLFVHPDDRWQLNNVANRCHEVVDLLRDTISQFERTLAANQIPEITPLAEILMTGMQ